MSNSTPSPHFPNNLQDYAPWVAEHGLLHPYGKCQCGCNELAPIAQWSATRNGYKKDHPKRFFANHAQKLKPSKAPSASVLHKMYITQNVEASLIASKFDVHTATVFKWLSHYGIERPTPARPSEEELSHLYFEQKLNSVEIGGMYGVSGRCIRDLMSEYGIARLGPAHLRKGKSAIWNVGIKHTAERKEMNRKAHLGKPPGNKGKGSVSFKCEVCGEEVLDKPYRRKRTCSKECKDKLSHIYRGESHWNYTDGAISSNQRQRMWAECREWRSAVMKRDNYTCAYCGNRGGKLVAHHLDGWADNPPKRFDTDNGVCLCHDCHWNFHRSYSLEHATKEMYLKWLATSLHD